MTLIACETEFNKEDPHNPLYSMTELDIYGGIPFKKQQDLGIDNHRLSIRKNMKTNKYEIYRHYYTFDNKTKDEVIFSSESLQETLQRVCSEYNNLISVDPNNLLQYKICDHKDNRAIFCKKTYNT
jgi:hypothetical protein